MGRLAALLLGFAGLLLAPGCSSGTPRPTSEVVPGRTAEPTEVTQPGLVAVGYAHGCAIRSDGGVSCWGGDGRDQLGNGRLGYAAEPVGEVESPAAVELAAGAHLTCARAFDGQVSCWGGGHRTVAPVQGIHETAQIAVASWMGCARNTDGTVSCWSDEPKPRNGALGYEALPMKGVAGAVELVAGGSHICVRTDRSKELLCRDWSDIEPPPPQSQRARPPRVTFHGANATDGALVEQWLGAARQTVDVNLQLCRQCSTVSQCVRMKDGEVICWGALDGAQTPAGFSQVAELAAGHRHLCGRLESGRVRCVGQARHESLTGRDPTALVPNEEIAGIDDAVEIDAGLLHTCVRHRTGAVSCWGENYSGQLGDGTVARSDQPRTVVGLTGALEVTAGLAHSCARLEGGSIRCWGWGESGQLGAAAPMQQPSKAPVGVVGLARVVELAGGFAHTCARVVDGRVWCWGAGTHGGGGCTPVALGDAPMECHGVGGGCGRVLDGRAQSYATPWLMPELGDVVDLDADGSWTCALSRSGEISCFGPPPRCEPEDQPIAPVKREAQVPRAVGLAQGGAHFCAVTEPGVVWCWGDNDHGQLGDGTTRPSKTPTLVTGLSGVVEVVAGARHSCARLATGEVQCWGFNVSGQLGNGAAKDEHRPVDVVGLHDATSLAAGDWHSCAVRRTGNVVCWGENERGSIGDGTTIDRVVPVPATASTDRAISLAAADYRTCVLGASRRVTCFGADDDDPLEPVSVP